MTILKYTYKDSTKSSYRTHMKTYASFCSVLGVPLVPAQPHLVALYCVLLSRTLRYGSIPQYLNIISLLHKSLDIPSPLSSFVVKSTLRGIKNSIGHESSIKLPVKPYMLYNILQNLNLNNINDACTWMTCIIMFYGLLRKSNLIGNHKILRKDCKILDDSIQLIIRSSKTRIKNSDPPRTLTLPRLKGHSLCPVAAIMNYFRLSVDLPLSAPLCSIPALSPQLKHTVLSYKSITNAVKKAVPPEDSESYSSHSFRRGGASYMYSIGMSLETIRIMGDWKSNCYQKYIVVDSSMV